MWNWAITARSVRLRLSSRSTTSPVTRRWCCWARSSTAPIPTIPSGINRKERDWRPSRRVSVTLASRMTTSSMRLSGLSMTHSTPMAIGALITVSLVGDMVGTYAIGLFADTWGRRRALALLALLMAATGIIFGLVTRYPVLLVVAFFGTLGTSASETAPFLPID